MTGKARKRTRKSWKVKKNERGKKEIRPKGDTKEGREKGGRKSLKHNTSVIRKKHN